MRFQICMFTIQTYVTYLYIYDTYTHARNTYFQTEKLNHTFMSYESYDRHSQINHDDKELTPIIKFCTT